jgi:hypothetical protein
MGREKRGGALRLVLPPSILTARQKFTDGHYFKGL